MAAAVIDLVLAVFKDPGMVADLRERPVPGDIAQVIRLAAGEAAALQAAQAMTGAEPATLVEASVFFLQQLLFAPQADSYRVLGATPDAPSERLREHYRWLMKWLHPDRNPDGWEAVYADRVNIAWQDLKTAERRAEYDCRLQVPVQALQPVGLPRRRAAAPAARAPMLSGSTVRRLPAIVLGSVAGIATLLMAAMYWAHRATERELASRGGDHQLVESPASAAVAPPPADAPGDVPVASPPPAWDEASAAASAIPAGLPVDTSPPAAAGALVAPSVTSDPAAMVAATASDARSANGTFADSIAAAPSATGPRALPASAPDASNPLSRWRERDGERVDGVPTASPLAPVAEEGSLPGDVAHRSGVVETPAEPPARLPVAATVAAASKPVPERPSPVTAPPAPESTAEPAPAPTPASADPTGLVQSDASPAESTSTPARTLATSAAIAQPSAEALVREFTAAYNAGDGRRFERLFSGDGGRGSSFESMRRRFDSTEMRFLELRELRWRLGPEIAEATARYRDTYVPRGSRKAVTEAGTIQWVLRMDAGDVRIAMLDRDAQR